MSHLTVAISEDAVQALFRQVVKTVEAMGVYAGHGDSVVEDVVWHTMHENIFASCGDDGFALVWDTRSSAQGLGKAGAAVGSCGATDHRRSVDISTI